MHHKRLGRFLQRLDRMRLPAQLGADFGGEQVQSDFADESGEGELGDEEVVGALVAADFFERDGAGLVAAFAACRGWVAGCWRNVRLRLGNGLLR